RGGEEMTGPGGGSAGAGAPGAGPGAAAPERARRLSPARRRRGARLAADFLREHRAVLVNRIEYWTGVRRSVIRALVTKMEETSARLNLAVPTTEAAALVELTTYATTLVMNFLTHGRFIPRARGSRRGRRGHDGNDNNADHRRPRR